MRFVLLSIAVLAACLCASCAPVEKGPNPAAQVHYTMGLSYLREPNPALALKEFLKARDLDPVNPDIHDGLAQAYFQKKAYAEAEQHYREAIRLSNGDPKYQNNLAALYIDMQRYDEAIEYFGKAAANLLFPDPEVAWVGMGYAYYLKHDYLDAVTSFNKALSIQPKYAQAHFHKGQALFALGKIPLAIESFEQARRLAPNSAQVRYHLGLSLVKNRQVKEAKAEFREVVKIAPGSEEGRQAREYLAILD